MEVASHPGRIALLLAQRQRPLRRPQRLPDAARGGRLDGERLEQLGALRLAERYDVAQRAELLEAFTV
jgi:hypothetical protein